ncbi:MAG: hypothetical protein K0S47_2835 [Herbinix sp.]|jgi:hypothetical protein|nr:hypothetical protein [Herbinix sp.]
MNIKLAKKMASQWIMNFTAKEKWFRGAYFSGSIIGMLDDAELSEHSDVDIVVVMSLDEPPMKLGKFQYEGVLLEVTYLSWKQLSSMEEVMTSYHLAGSFRTDTIITDPTGNLKKLQVQISQHFAEKAWVSRRCENVKKKIEDGLNNIAITEPFYDTVTSWLFPAGVTTHMILVAALKNPTVRKRYLAARDVLMEYGYEDIYEQLIELLGCARLTQQRMENHLNNLAHTFDAAVVVSKTPFAFSTDITDSARPIAIDGSLDLIRAGNHREACFWIVATYARCHKILAVDAPLEIQEAHMPAFRELVADLGLHSNSDFTCRAQEVIQFLPRLWEVTEDILSRNPDIIKKNVNNAK